jgi:hypothetical protein
MLRSGGARVVGWRAYSWHIISKGFIFDDNLWIAQPNVRFMVRGGGRWSEWGEGGRVVQLGFNLSDDCQELVIGCHVSDGGRRSNVDRVDADSFRYDTVNSYIQFVHLFGVSLGEILEALRCMYISFWLPGVMCLAVSLPPDAILELLSYVSPHVYNAFNFVLFFAIDKVRRWFFKVRTMFFHLLIWG